MKVHLHHFNLAADAHVVFSCGQRVEGAMEDLIYEDV